MMKRLKYRSQFAESDLRVTIANFLRLHKEEYRFDLAADLTLTMPQALRHNKLQDRGFPDLVIYNPKHGYHGLMIELKADGEVLLKKDGKEYRKNEHVEEQYNRLLGFQRRGYYSTFAVGWTEFLNVYNAYISNNTHHLDFYQRKYLLKKEAA